MYTPPRSIIMQTKDYLAHEILGGDCVVFAPVVVIGKVVSLSRQVNDKLDTPDNNCPSGFIRFRS